MTFKVLYVEDDKDERKDMQRSVEFVNNKGNARSIELILASTIDEFRTKLSPEVDFILADVYLPTQVGEDVKLKNRLDDVCTAVEQLRNQEDRHSSYPVIAYTGTGADTLDECLRMRNRLFDIWDKASCQPEYVAWRLSRIALSYSKDHPDSVLQKSIRMSKLKSNWHKYVIKSAVDYSKGWNEFDQISRVGTSIRQMADEFGTEELCTNLWKVMEQWEQLSRVTSKKARGHARHVVNVFWLGYRLISEPKLREYFDAVLQKLSVRRRWESLSLSDEQPLSHLANIWFYASLFHDVGQFVQKRKGVQELVDGLYSQLGNSFDVQGENRLISLSEGFRKEAELLIDEGHNTVGETIRSLLENATEHSRFDHGLVSAVTCRMLAKQCQSPAQIAFVNEAARGMAIHNVFPETDQDTEILTWDEEPIACLLVVCDQLQTWDRERGDRKLRDHDGPERAEISRFSVTQRAGRIRISGTINYLAPEELNYAPRFFDKVKDDLEDVLKTHPKRAIDRIKGPWPFDVEFDCWLNNTKLDTKITNRQHV